MSERIVADPPEVATSRQSLDLTDWISAQGIDWGDAEIQGYMSEQGYGSVPVDFRVPNRTIQIPLMLQARGGTSFTTARENIQAKVALWQQEGGWLGRVTSSGGTLYCDIVNATLRLPGGWMQAHRDADSEASLTLEALPDFYGNEVTLNDHVETSAAELIFTETSIDGNYPARVRMVIDEDQGQSQLGLMWGFQSRNYSDAATAALAYEAEALGTLDTATRGALTGASGGTVVTHGTLSTSWTPVLNLAVGGTSFLTHIGSYRMWCRYRTTSGTAVALRAVYDVGDLVYPVENEPWYDRGGGTSFYVASLGELRLDRAKVGTHRWTGMIQAKGAASGENVSIDRVWFQPLDECAGILRSPLEADIGLSPYSARDSFDQSAGTLTAKTLPVGGTWSGAGDADDFAVEATGHTAQRTAVSDTTLNTGRFVTASTPTLAAVVVQADISVIDPPESENLEYAVVARYVDTSNHVRAYLQLAGPSFGLDSHYLFLRVSKTIAGTRTTVGVPRLIGPAPSAIAHTLRLLITETGHAAAWAFPIGGTPGNPGVFGFNGFFDTGSTLDDGKVGLYDVNTSATAVTRTYNNFAAWIPSLNAVVHPNQSAELRTDGMLREDSTGSAYGPVSWVEGDLPRLPVAGLENRTVQVMVKGSRGDFDVLPDAGIDDISARVFYRPCWLTVPGT